MNLTNDSARHQGLSLIRIGVSAQFIKLSEAGDLWPGSDACENKKVVSIDRLFMKMITLFLWTTIVMMHEVSRFCSVAIATLAKVFHLHAVFKLPGQQCVKFKTKHYRYR